MGAMGGRGGAHSVGPNRRNMLQLDACLLEGRRQCSLVENREGSLVRHPRMTRRFGLRLCRTALTRAASTRRAPVMGRHTQLPADAERERHEQFKSVAEQEKPARAIAVQEKRVSREGRLALPLQKLV